MSGDFNAAAWYGDRKTPAGLVPAVCDIARGAGAILMRYYADTSGKSWKVRIKDDQSPVTAADQDASKFIVDALTSLTPAVPVVSEENDVTPDGTGGAPYWVVDPLDGTLEFMGRTGGFQVKIALIDGQKPVLGVVYSPVHDTLYYTSTGAPAMRRIGTQAPTQIQTVKAQSPLRVLFNHTHGNPALYDRVRGNLAGRLALPRDPMIVPGLPRNLQVAQGTADLHVVTGLDPDISQGGGYLWDVAADHLILRNAGGSIALIAGGGDMPYIHPRLRVPGYYAFGDPGLRTKLVP